MSELKEIFYTMEAISSMKDNTAIHPLAQDHRKSGKITFHADDGSEHTFCSCVNRLTGDRMNWFDNEAPYIGGTIKELHASFEEIRQVSPKVVSCIGDF